MNIPSLLLKQYPEDIPEADLEQLLEVIRSVYGYDFTQYSRASLRRRLKGYMIMRNISEIRELRRQIVADESFFIEFLENLTVTVTEMFRDPAVYKMIREKVVAELNTWPFIRIWHAGCSTGEEVLSMAILLREENLLGKSRIYATDINAKAVSKARAGITHISQMQDYTRNYIEAGGKGNFSDYYKVVGNQVHWDHTLLDNITFSVHNLASDRSFNEFNLIICRNVMIYFNKDLQENVVQLFLESLSPFGYLLLGNKESLLFSRYQENFEVVDKRDKLYRRIK